MILYKAEYFAVKLIGFKVTLKPLTLHIHLCFQHKFRSTVKMVTTSLAQIIEMCIWRDKKSIIPICFFAFYAKLCNVFKIPFWMQNSANYAGTFSRFFNKLPKSLIMWHSMHHFPKFCKVKWNYAFSILYTFPMFSTLILAIPFCSLASKLGQFCIFTCDCTELCCVTEARYTCTLRVEVKWMIG